MAGAGHIGPPVQARSHVWLTLSACLLLALAAAFPAIAHDVSQSNAKYVEGISGPAPIPFLYLGAKHMVTGLDHVFFLIGVVFFLRRFGDIVAYVSLFTLGHSLTLILGVLANVSVNVYLVDALIGLSVVYKAFENIGGFQRSFGRSFDMRAAVFGFGLIHGLGLATKLQALSLSDDGLIVNLLAFNVGVEIGQVLVLVCVVWLLNIWRQSPRFETHAWYANLALMTGGFVLMGQHLAGYFLEGRV
ncbi:HupE/UreJ family protein [Henriciella litoralis]|uniref:HupE/UreJ family protein n=1 Tax=Henriciella litoralis TaxID=568102 RepID=UPI0038995F60